TEVVLRGPFRFEITHTKNKVKVTNS
ncbi:MAG: hypothetical protein RL044_1039, partial [Actinomycetota bacterium]